ncbi:MAG: Rrf2 family transcriptional regulator [Epsilonproteobacteria bacterium]|nr:Rrf2 family transcriptional regulator [Campylobacterota bacterium]
MPLLSSKGMYGIRAMYELSKLQQDKPIPVSQIVGITGISQNYLEQILGRLAKAKILKVQRGINGGYLLAKDAKEIMIKDIVFALENNLKIANKDNCHMLNLFIDDLQKSIEAHLNISLDDFEKYKEKFNSSLHFNI